MVPSTCERNSANYVEVMATISAVLFDVGGVLTQPLTPLVIEAAIATGLDLTGLQEALRPMFVSEGDGDEPAHLMERGLLSLDTFLAGLSDGPGASGEAAKALFNPESEQYVFKRFEPHKGMVKFVQDVQASGRKIGVVSNVITEWLPAWNNVLNRCGCVFDTVVMSCEVGFRKPNPAIYQLALDRLGISASDALFIDDFAPMAQGARNVGIEAITLVDHDVAINEGRELLGIG